MGIMIILASFALFFSFDFYRTYTYNAEITNLATALTKARNQSLANINQKEHGVRVESNNYYIFEGSSYVAGPNNIVIPSGSGTVASGDVEVVFERLTGKAKKPSGACPCTITLNSQSRSKPFTINAEGGIEW